MDFLYFLKSLKIYLKNNNFSNIENEDDWKNLKRNLIKKKNKKKKYDMDIEESIDNNNKILKSLLENFRKNINDYLSKKGETKEYKEALILGIENYFDKNSV